MQFIKKFRLYILLVTSILFISVGSYGQNDNIDVKLEKILTEMPTPNISYRNMLMEEVYNMGDDGFQKLIKKLSYPEGNDAAVRYAINSFARYASEFGKPEMKKFTEENLLKALNAADNNYHRTFIIRQLNLIGTLYCIPELTKYLTDAELCEPAVQVLLRIKGAKAEQAVLGAFPNAKGKSKVSLARAIGVLESTKGVELLTPLAKSKDKDLKKSVLISLAQIGSYDSYNVLYDAAEKVRFLYEPTDAMKAFLIYVDRLGQLDNKKLIEKAVSDIGSSCSSKELLHNYAAALKLYAEYYGNEVTPLLLDAVSNSDLAFRYAVLNIAQKVVGVEDTRKWMKKAEESSREVTSDIVLMLGRRGDEVAIPFIVSLLDAENSVVSQAAVHAIAIIQGRDAVPVLIDHLLKGKDIEATRNILLSLLDKGHLFQIADVMDDTQGQVKAACMELIAAKGGTQYFDKIFQNLSSSDKVVRKAAYNALKDVATYKYVHELIELLSTVQGDEEIKQAQLALMAAVKGIGHERRDVGIVNTFLDKAEKKSDIVRFIPILQVSEGPVALEKVTKFYNSSDNDIKEASFNALINWKEYPAVNQLYVICKNSTGEHRKKAFDAYVNLVYMADIPDDEKLLRYKFIEPLAPEIKDKNAIISKVGEIKSFPVLVYLGTFLDEEELQKLTTRSIMNIALPASDCNGFYGDIVRGLLTKSKEIMTGDDSGYYKISIQNYLDKMRKDKGYIKVTDVKSLNKLNKKEEFDKLPGYKLIYNWKRTNKTDNQEPYKCENPVGEWNTVRIIKVGDKLILKLNGYEITRDVNNIPLLILNEKSGKGDFAFDEIYYEKLDKTPYGLTAKEELDGFVSLFNGKNLDGWIGNTKEYVVNNEEITVDPEKGSNGGNLYTIDEYSDFVLRFEFKLTAGGNNGIGIRTPLNVNAAYEGMEIQVLDNTAPQYEHLKPYQYHGSVYGVIPAKRGYLNPMGDWNYEEIYVKGTHVKVTLNGTVILDGDIAEANSHGTLDGLPHPGLKRTLGHIGFLGHSTVVSFRKIRIKEL